MEIKPGYKQTEIGVIPEDWSIGKLSSSFPLQRGFDLPQSKAKEGCNPVVYSNGILNFHNEAMCKGPGVVTGRSGTLGKVFFIESDYWPHNTTLWVTNFKGNNPKYVFYLLSYLHTEKHGTGSGVPTLNRNDLHDLIVSLPPESEQKLITSVLTDIDSLITSLEKLIEKKKLIKQGVMQELLTGKRRLPGFSGEWKAKRLGDFFALQYGKPKKESDRVKTAGVPVYGSNGVVGYSSDKLTSNPTIIIGRKGAAGLVHHSSGGCWPIDTTFYIEFDDYTESLFYYYLLQCAGLDRIKSDSAVPGLNRADAYALMITVPSKEERIQIAEILLSIDQEITYLTDSLDKHKLLKQAMMLELLTGRIRLV